MRLPYKKLMIWQKAIQVAKAAYFLTKQLPKEEKFGLQQQIRRAAISVPSNIAEGSQRLSDKEFSYFIAVAKGSLAELETQLLLCVELQLLTADTTVQSFTLINDLQKMLRSFSSSPAANH